jgi:hypothetical protein
MSLIADFQFLNLNFFFLINQLFCGNLISGLLAVLQYFLFLISPFLVEIYTKYYWNLNLSFQIYIFQVLLNMFEVFHKLLLIQTLLNFNFVSLSNLHIILLISKIGCNLILIYKVQVFLKILVSYRLPIFKNLLIL